MWHSVPVIDLFECGVIFAHVIVHFVVFVDEIRMHPLESNITVCSQFAGDGRSNFGAVDFTLILAFEFASPLPNLDVAGCETSIMLLAFWM
jgi:hypothetical protein